MGAGNLQDIGSVLAQDPGDGGTGNDPAEFQDLDSFQGLFASRVVGWEWSWRRVAFQARDLPWRFLHVKLALNS